MTETCPFCGSASIKQRVDRTFVQYGEAPCYDVPVDLPIDCCGECGEEWEGEDAFLAKAEAIEEFVSTL